MKLPRPHIWCGDGNELMFQWGRNGDGRPQQAECIPGEGKKHTTLSDFNLEGSQVQPRRCTFYVKRELEPGSKS
jgi:hypothetical protein